MDQNDVIQEYNEFKYDKYGRVDTVSVFSVKNFSAYLKSKISPLNMKANDTPEKNSMTEPFLINDQNHGFLTPFRRMPVSYLTPYDYGKQSPAAFNNAGFPKLISYVFKESGDTLFKYELLYINSKKEDFDWSKYISSKNKPAFQKATNLESLGHISPLKRLRKQPSQTNEVYASLDLRNGAPLSLSELAERERSQILNTGDGNNLPKDISGTKHDMYDVQRMRLFSQSVEANRFVTVYSLNKSTLRVENYSEYAFVVHITGYKDMRLAPRTGASYEKAYVTDSSKISIEYPDSAFVLRDKALLYEIKKFGGEADATSQNIDFILKSFLNREPIPSPTIVWKDEAGNTIKVEEPDPVNEEFQTQAGNLLGMIAAKSAKESLEKRTKRLALQLSDNRDIFAASKGIKNKYEDYFKYQPLKNYTEVKFKNIK